MTMKTDCESKALKALSETNENRISGRRLGLISIQTEYKDYCFNNLLLLYVSCSLWLNGSVGKVSICRKKYPMYEAASN